MLEFTKFLLWSALILSAVVTCASPFVERQEKIARAGSEASDRYFGGTPNAQGRFIFDLNWEMNRYSGAPTIFVLSAGFLALLTVGSHILAKLTDLAALTEAGLDESAAAMRRAARLGPAAVAAEALIAGGLAAAARKPKGGGA
jgi:hypothetical protein